MTTPLVYSANNIITDALQKLGVYAPSESVTDADMTRGLTVLNDMLDQWQSEDVFVFSLTTLALTLTNGTPTYSIGPPGSSADIVSGRPNRIQGGPGAASVSDGTTTSPVNVVSSLEWSAFQSQNSGVGTPDTLFFDPQYPVGILNVAPSPYKNGFTLTFYSLVPFTLFAAQSTSASFSQGTADALKCNLAVCAKPYFASAQLDPIIAMRADASKEFLRTANVTSRAKLKRVQSPTAKPAAPANPA